jgi:hypothetical protein
VDTAHRELEAGAAGARCGLLLVVALDHGAAWQQAAARSPPSAPIHAHACHRYSQLCAGVRGSPLGTLSGQTLGALPRHGGELCEAEKEVCLLALRLWAAG